MASISNNGRGIVVRFDRDDWLAGLLPHWGSSNIGSRIGKGFSFVTGGINPYRFPGYLSPSFEPEDAINDDALNGTIRNGVIRNQRAYLIGGALIHQYTPNIHTITNDATWPHTIGDNLSGHDGHSTFAGSDIIIYPLNGTPYLFYSWNNSSDGDIGRYDFSTTFADDYVSDAATNGAVLNKDHPHPMIVGDNGVLYIGNGRYLASLDGRDDATGTWTAQALDLPDGYSITSFAKTSSFLVIYARKPNVSSGSADPGDDYRSEATAFFFDYNSSSFTYAFPLPGNYVNGGFIWKGTPGCFVGGDAASGSNHTSSMAIFDGSSFELVEGTQFNGNAPIHGGVEVNSSTVTWNSDGTIFRFGSPYSEFSDKLNIIADAGSGAGMVKNFFSDQLVIASNGGNPTTYNLNRYTANYAEATAYTGLVQLPSSRAGRWHVHRAIVTFKDTVDAGRGFKIAINTDNNAAASDARNSLTYLINTTDPVAISSIRREFYYDVDTKALPNASTSIGVYFQWGAESPTTNDDAAVVEAVELYLEPIAN